MEADGVSVRYEEKVWLKGYLPWSASMACTTVRRKTVRSATVRRETVILGERQFGEGLFRRMPS